MRMKTLTNFSLKECQNKPKNYDEKEKEKIIFSFSIHHREAERDKEWKNRGGRARVKRLHLKIEFQTISRHKIIFDIESFVVVARRCSVATVFVVVAQKNMKKSNKTLFRNLYSGNEIWRKREK